MATVHEILDFLFSLAPEAGKEPWDHVGLMVGDRSRPVETVLVALDPFYPVCQEAAARGAQLLVTHHPLFFGGTHAVTDETEDGRSAMLLLEHGMAHIAMHTNLDAAHGGVNDCLAARLGLREVTGLLGEIPCLGRVG
ncbi:MAG: Nif3-like dinuclear metal center hexameric protein, partial [Oscillospiraceae bacterium]|nr:Nif3-like dinuclear metal center hexameric protein [Oscillospiraceae bacterium]